MNIKFLTLPIACGVMLLPYSMCFGAVRVSNNSAARYGFVTAPTVNNAAAAVNSVNRTTPDTVDTPVDAALENCQAIYPTGEFEIARPTIGNRRMGAQQCTAIVELRGYQMGPNGTDLVLARSKLAAGDNFKCNIDSFPEADMNVIAVESVAFPRDNEPTVDDVIAQMNQEQKQNAGLKIAAAALAGGIGGNLLGKNDVGNDSMFGTDKGKLISTGAGAAGAAALMAASTYSGKVAGDVILSTGVNATAGAVVGNIAAKNSGGSYLHIERGCSVRESEGADFSKAEASKDNYCLWGKIEIGKMHEFSTNKVAYWSPLTGRVMECTTITGSKDEKTCTYISLRKIKITEVEGITWDKSRKDENGNQRPPEYTDEMFQTEKEQLATKCNFYLDPETDKIADGGQEGADIYCEINSAKDIGKSTPALILLDEGTAKDIQKNGWKNSKLESDALYVRDSKGNGTRKYDVSTEEYDFTPLTIDSDDGGLVDFSNKARAKGTAIGAGAGGALGGFVAYQGAQSDINDRWVSEVRQYKDSLQKFYCQTGNRFLSYYNDVVIIPEPPEITE
ncbi:MAG: hypothetical protein MJ170_04240 [Alphaproteobacteria bacterium]|nr:hypothetical protein [Alphaproteobacteria bacterium]